MHVELDIRAIKATLQMEMLGCRTPFMLENKIWATFLGYNLVRKVSCLAAWQRGCSRGKSVSRRRYKRCAAAGRA